MSELYKKLPSQPDYNPGWAPADKWEDCGLAETASNGYGVIGYYGGNSHLMREAYPFIREQFKRFGLSAPQDDFIEWCWDQAFYYIDQFDPYALMSGCCDVIKTEEAYFYQYKVTDDGYEWNEVSPDDIETFAYWDKGKESWEILMQYPGLQEYFDHIHDYFMDHFQYIMTDDHPEAYETEWEFITRYGDKVQDFAHLGIWASIMWMCSPLDEARAWRYEFHPIFRMCYDFGSALLNGWTFHDPRYFERIERKAKSCSSCGVDEWCVELTQVDHDQQAFLCENCLSGGLPFPGRSCGTKLCEHTTCPNHPVAQAPESEKSVARREMMALAADERFGVVHQLPDGRKVRELPGYIKLNEIAINHYSKSIADTVSDVFAGLIGPGDN